jgi:hypothetical protein
MSIRGASYSVAGSGMYRALFPSDMGNTLGLNGPLPNAFQHPSRGFGVVMTTPGGITTSQNWGFTDRSFGALRAKVRSMSRRRKTIRRRRGSRRRKTIRRRRGSR